MDYYFLEYVLTASVARITTPAEWRISPNDWRTGSVLAKVPETPVRFRIMPGDGGALPPYVNDPIPLMVDELVTSLREVGADNIETFEAVIEDGDRGAVHRGYQAVNILGLVDCVAEEAQTFTPFPMIDGTRAKDFALFRVASHPGLIAIQRRIKLRLQSREFGAALDFRVAKVIADGSLTDVASTGV